ncbi:MAG TPA: LCP family protein [Patescibacteria group bacterium]|nr:LCP family protein [Patescibacteria group bacterium]
MHSRRQRHVRKRVVIALFVFFLILGGLVGLKVAKFIPPLFDLTFTKEIQLKETKEKRINLLLLGVGGGTHEGPDLTDTIIFASIDPVLQKVTLVSIPRDLWIADLRAKINTMYVFAEEKQQGAGLQVAKETVGKIVGQQIDYAVKIDFSGFEKAVDLMGGLDVDVENTLDDYSYPITGEETNPCDYTEEEIIDLTTQIATGAAQDFEVFPCRYEHLHFDPGMQHMDGTTALKYVRSRHAVGSEGSDFARSKRQEKVLAAFKEEVFSAGTLLNPVTITGLVGTLAESIETDIKENEYDDFVKLARKVEKGSFESIALDVGDASQERYGLLYNPPISSDFGGAWVLIPRSGHQDYSEIKEYIVCRIENKGCEVGASGILTPTPLPSISTKE